MKTFVETVKAYSAWKLKENGDAKISRDEMTVLREEYQEEIKVLKEAKEKPTVSRQLKEACDNLLKWKKENGKTEEILKEELDKIKEILREKNKEYFKLYVSNYKKFKEAANQEATLTEKELKILKENFKESLRSGIALKECVENFDVKEALKEADMGMNPAAPMAGDPNAMAGGMPAAPPAPADPMALQGAIDAALAALQPVATGGGNALGADPNAGIPPVDGSGAPAAGPAPGAAPTLMEATDALIAWKKANGKGETLTESETALLQEQYGPKEKSEFDKIQERIATREAKLVDLQNTPLQEGAVQDSQRKIDNGKGYPTPVSNSHGGDHTVTQEQVVVPAASKLANGYASGPAAGEISPAKTWPTSAVGKEAGGALQGKGATQTKMKEEQVQECTCGECEDCKGKTKIEEALTVTDIYVQRALEPKLDFAQIRESMKSGLLG